MEGTPFGRYRFVELVGRGGMGEVWKAFDTRTRRIVAVKVLPSQLAADPKFAQRFRREADAAAGLNDPHVVPIHDFGEIDGRLYVDMRLIEGQDLDHLLTDGPLEPGRAVMIIEQVASALNAAHRVGLVHRDVKPSNILVAEDDFAYLIDFGIARGAGDTGLTGTGNVIGTWPYMAPERFTTGLIDSRADIYALACVLYECLTCSRPFPGDSIDQQIAGHLTTPPPRPSINRPEVPAQLDDVIAAGMAKDPGERYGTTVELARAARSAITAPVTQPLEQLTTPTRQPDPATTPVWAAPKAHQTENLRDATAAIPPPIAPGAPTTAARAQQNAPVADWAPTQMRPPEHVSEPLAAMAPTQASPPEAAPTRSALPDARASVAPPPAREATTPPPAEPWWLRKAIVIPISIIAILAATVVMVSVLTGNDNKPGQQSGAVTTNLDGTYAVDFEAATQPNGQPFSNWPGGRETWVIKSACPSSGCVATATRVSGSQSASPTMVLDKNGQTWTAVTAAQGTCANAATEYWESMTLQSQASGSLTGRFVSRSTTLCARNQQVSFVRTGDAQAGVGTADPSSQPALVASPANGLHGSYQVTNTYAVRTAQGNSETRGYDIATYCLRDGQRCLSYWQDVDPNAPGMAFLFAQSKWVLTNTSYDGKCQNGGNAQKELTLEYPLPQPAQDPIALLTGRGHYTITGTCPYSSDLDSRAERTGD